MRLRIVCSLLLIGCAFNIASAKNKSSIVWLDDLDIAKYKNESAAVKNKSVGGQAIAIAGKQFEHGVGIAVPGVLKIKLDKGSKRFTSFVGIDDSAIEKFGKHNIVVSIVGDNGQVLWEGKLKIKKPVEVDVNLVGVNELYLYADTVVPGSAYLDWADAKFEVCGVKPKTQTVCSQPPYILTPKSSDVPKINSVEIFGVRPGHPFLYRIPATGKRPMEFSVQDLPNGLTINTETGIITGTISNPGTYKMQLVATNSVDTARREFTVKVSDKICLTPPMGWNSWNCWGKAVDEKKVRLAAEAMVKSGLVNHGWTYINIDDCWQGARNPATGEITSNEKFPDMQELTDYVHSLGLKIGLYTDCGPNTCARYEGSEGYEEQDIKTYQKWGFDYVKIDWCFCEDKDPYESYSKFGDAIAKADRDIVFSICEWGKGKPWLWGQKAGGNCWRTTRDIVDTWQSILKNGFSQGDRWQYAGPGYWNDPDMLVVGKVGWGAVRQTRLTPDEQYAHISLWSLLASPLLIGCDMSKMDNFTLSLLTNDEVIAVNQDILGSQAKQLQSGVCQVWVKDLNDGSKAVGLFNLLTVERAIEFQFVSAGLTGRYNIRDLWRQKDIETAQNEFKINVPAHGVIFIKMTSIK
jgi:alpha-galactosidase